MKIAFARLALLIMTLSQADSATLAAHWTLDDGTGTNANDQTANNRDGTLAGGVSWINSGLAPVPTGTTAALNFAGAGQQVNVTGYQGVTGTASRSVSAWIRTTNTNSNQDMAILSWGNNLTGEKWTFRVQSGNGTQGALRIEANGGYHVGSTVLTDGNWHHVAVTLSDDGSPDITEALLYVDGVLEATSASLGQAINTSSLNDVRLGIDFVGRPWLGDLDEVRIYEGVLTPGEIASLAGIPEPSSVALFSLGSLFLLRRRRR